MFTDITISHTDGLHGIHSYGGTNTGISKQNKELVMEVTRQKLRTGQTPKYIMKSPKPIKKNKQLL